MQDGIFNGGKRTQRTGYISTKHIYYYNTYAGKAMKQKQAHIQANKSKGKHDDRI